MKNFYRTSPNLTFLRGIMMRRLILTGLLAVSFLAFAWGNAFAIKFFDDKLSIWGDINQTFNIRTHQDGRDIRYSSFRTTSRLEAIYNAVENEDMMIDFYIMGNYYYDFALDLDSDLRKSIRIEAGGRHKYRDARRPRNDEEWLKEVYLNVKYKNFQLRLGKQLVSWGETADSRVADLINPLDIKYIIAFPEWEDFKLGLWMARLYWTPERMWQDLAFELIVIPFDYEETRLPIQGYPTGGNAGTSNSIQKLFDKMRRDAPNDGTGNFEIGLRIKGYANIGEGVDWTLSHFYTRSDFGLVNGEEAFRDLSKIFFGGIPDGKVFTYPHFNSTALTFATTWARADADVRGECAYNTNVDYAYGVTQSSSFKIKEKDLLTTSLRVGRKWFVPYSSDGFLGNKSRSVEASLTVFQYWLLNMKHNKATGEFVQWDSGTRDSRWTKLSFFLSSGFLHETLLPVGVGVTYDFNGNSLFQFLAVYQPGDRWSWTAVYQQANEASPSARINNQVILSMRYEFH
jgi:hypothetical protein